MNYTTNNTNNYTSHSVLPFRYERNIGKKRIETDECVLKPKTKSFVNRILLKIGNEKKWIDCNEIKYLQAESNYTKLYLVNVDVPILVSKSLKYFANQLDTACFIRTHRSYLVNAFFVQSFLRYRKPSLRLNNGERIQISRRRLKSIKLFYNKQTS